MLGMARLIAALSISISLCFVSISHGAVFTVDYGSENIKVSVVDPKPGMSPINIAINEMSKRKSPALVAISNGERLLSEEAAGILARYPERVYSRARDLVGRPAKDLIDMLRDSYLPFEVSSDEDRSTLLVRSHDKNMTFNAEDLVALILNYARDLAAAHSKGSVKDAVISIPPFFSQSQRQAIFDAADIIGLNVMSLIQEHAAVAIQYGIDKDFSNGTRNVLFYDMGANSVYAALVEFSAYTVKERGKNSSVNQFQVKALRWDAELGGQSFESRLLEHFADEFNKQASLPEDVRSSYKAMAKLKKQVKRTKEVLSANTEALLSVESLFEDKDFRTTISREQFEALCADLWERAVLPVQLVLKDTGLTSKDIHAVELVGGSTRVPRLQSALSAALDNRELDRHLDADESVALGASLLAANLSDGFKLNRKIGMMDGIPYGVQFRLHLDSTVPADRSPEEEALQEAQSLFPRLKRTPSKSTRNLKNLKEDFSVEVMYDLQPDHLPVPLGSRQIALYDVTGLANATAKYSGGQYNLSAPLRTTLYFSLSRSGLTYLDRAELAVEYHEWVDVPVPVLPPPADNSTVANASAATGTNSSSNATAATDTAVVSDAGNSTESVPEVVYEKKLRKRTVRAPLQVKDVSDGIAKGLSEEAKAAARGRLDLLADRERRKRELAEAKNSLEAFVYSFKDKLESDEDLITVTTSAQRSALLTKLEEAEEWLYSDGEAAEVQELRSRLADLKELSQPMSQRASELRARPAAVEEASKFFASAAQKVGAWKTSKPWLNETDVDSLLSEVQEAKQWTDSKTKEQKKKKLTEEPAFETSALRSKLARLQAKVARLEKIPKPRPKPAPKSNSTAPNATAAEDSSSPAGDGEAAGRDEL